MTKTQDNEIQEVSVPVQDRLLERRSLQNNVVGGLAILFLAWIAFNTHNMALGMLGLTVKQETMEKDIEENAAFIDKHRDHHLQEHSKNVKK